MPQGSRPFDIDLVEDYCRFFSRFTAHIERKRSRSRGLRVRYCFSHGKQYLRCVYPGGPHETGSIWTSSLCRASCVNGHPLHPFLWSYMTSYACFLYHLSCWTWRLPPRGGSRSLIRILPPSRSSPIRQWDPERFDGFAGRHAAQPRRRLLPASWTVVLLRVKEVEKKPVNEP